METYRLQSLCPVIPASSSPLAAAAAGLAAGDVRVVGGVLLRHRETAVETPRIEKGLVFSKVRKNEIRLARTMKYQVGSQKVTDSFNGGKK